MIQDSDFFPKFKSTSIKKFRIFFLRNLAEHNIYLSYNYKLRLPKLNKIIIFTRFFTLVKSSSRYTAQRLDCKKYPGLGRPPNNYFFPFFFDKWYLTSPEQLVREMLS